MRSARPTFGWCPAVPVTVRDPFLNPFLNHAVVWTLGVDLQVLSDKVNPCTGRPILTTIDETASSEFPADLRKFATQRKLYGEILLAHGIYIMEQGSGRLD